MSVASLPPEFWAEFLEKHWNREPVHLRRPFSSPLVQPEEVFQAMVRAGDRVRASERVRPAGSPVRERLYSEKRFRLAGPQLGKYLPQQGDASGAAYAERLRGMLDGEHFGLILNDFQVDDWELWMQWRGLLRNLLPHLPPQTADLVLLFGDYEGTPFGVHQDRRHTFIYVVEGRRRYRLWPDETFRTPARRQAQGTLDYEPYLPDAITLDAGPGDLVYWSPSFWHVGECADSLSLTVGVGLEPFFPRAEIWKELAEQVRVALTEADRQAALDPRGVEPEGGDGFLREVAAMAAEVTRNAAAEAEPAQLLAGLLLNRESADGFELVPPPLPPVALADEDRVAGSPDYPVRWRIMEDRSMVCSAHGHAFAVPASPRTLELLRRLNAGAPLRVGDAVREYAGEVRTGGVGFRATGEAVRSLLEELLCFRAITRVE